MHVHVDVLCGAVSVFLFKTALTEGGDAAASLVGVENQRAVHGWRRARASALGVR